MDTFADRLSEARARIDAAARRVGRDPAEIAVVAVSKTRPPEDLRTAVAAGQTKLGENYVQELLRKQDVLADLAGRVEWHYIGHLQTNKARQLVGRTALLHAVDSPRLLDELDVRSRAAGVVTALLLQVNVAREATKSGCSEEELPALVAHARSLPGVRLRGLMTMPPFFDDPDAARPHFARLRILRDALVARDPALAEPLRELSMGMSGDFEVAVEEGATLVRIGALLFGARE